MRRWAAARPLAAHAASFARRVASKPGQALQASHHPPIGPPPFGTADTSPAGLAPPSDRAVSPDERDKTPPAPHVKCTPGTKLSQHTTKRRYQAISRLQGELFHAYGRGKPSRENFVPHTGPLAGQNSPRSTHQPKQRDKILPARHKTLILACFTHAGRVLSRI